MVPNDALSKPIALKRYTACHNFLFLHILNFNFNLQLSAQQLILKIIYAINCTILYFFLFINYHCSNETWLLIVRFMKNVMPVIVFHCIFHFI